MSISDSRNDTRLSQSINTIETLHRLSAHSPFAELSVFLEYACSGASGDNGASADNKSEITLANNAASLHAMMHNVHGRHLVDFVDQSLYEGDGRYYEQIIFESKQVPTRANWHDFFNGLIWLQFPNTKGYFNASHIEQITACSNVKKRTPVRDRLTHFDECGLVLFTTSDELQELIQEHQWQALFCEKRSRWDAQIVPVIFGHALWEMLLTPFIGLTAKVLVIKVSASDITMFKCANQKCALMSVLYAKYDALLLDHIKQNSILHKPKPWLPLPLLGIPGWATFAQTDAFYKNTDYFMPKRVAKRP